MFSMQYLSSNPLKATFQLSSAASLNLGLSQNGVLVKGLKQSRYKNISIVYVPFISRTMNPNRLAPVARFSEFLISSGFLQRVVKDGQSCFTYGPAGSLLRKNIEDLW